MNGQAWFRRALRGRHLSPAAVAVRPALDAISDLNCDDDLARRDLLELGMTMRAR